MLNKKVSVIETGAVPDGEGLQTEAFQKAIDLLYFEGGGAVEVPAGKYTIGSIRLRSNITLHLLSGAEIYGTRNVDEYNVLNEDTIEPLPEDMKSDVTWNWPKIDPVTKEMQKRNYEFLKPGARWNNGLIRIICAENVAIIGEPGSVIDGCDPYDPLGEEEYRGPHGINMYYSENVRFEGYTIRNTGNWAHCITYCKNIVYENVIAEAGHDGIHCTRCENVVIANSEFYTGDDCIAGFGNVNVLVHDCIVNTACSGLRFGGTNALIRNCRFFGPAKHYFRGRLSLEDKIKGTHSEVDGAHKDMLSLFTYYADFSYEIPEEPGNIIIRDCTVENVQRFIHYNYSGNERWQKNRPLRSLTMENIKATGITLPATAYGSEEMPLWLTLKNIDLEFAPGNENTAAFHIANIAVMSLENVKISGRGKEVFAKTWTKGSQFNFKNVACDNNSEPSVVYTEEPFTCKPI